MTSFVNKIRNVSVGVTPSPGIVREEMTQHWDNARRTAGLALWNPKQVPD